MWFLWFSSLLQLAFLANAEFGTPYLHKSQLCQPWNCVSSKLGIPNRLPPIEQYRTTLQALLPSGPWQDAADKALEACYNHRNRNYVTTCPVQALLHCTVDNLIENCPEENSRKDDGCYPVSSLAGVKHMFTQSRYKDLEKNLPKEMRPAWFMRNYFNSKCCNLPELINSTVLSECGFTHFVKYYDHQPRDKGLDQAIYLERVTTHKPSKGVFDFNSVVTKKSNLVDQLKIVPLPDDKDPLQCCDLEGFIHPEWRAECGFQLSWDKDTRLTVNEEFVSTTTETPSTTRAPLNNDVRVVPLSCEKETCIFKKLEIINASGSVDVDAFSRLLDNFTSIHPTWMKAKARVITQCLTRTSTGYEADCEINKLLACTLDVLSENCPYARKNDTCKHSRQNSTVCQISSARYRPKNRRAVCGLPNLVSSEVLVACGVTSVSRTEYVPDPPVAKPAGWTMSKYSCKDSTPPTVCIMSKMGVLNKYNFMDYFKMKDMMRLFTSQVEWAPMEEFYLNVFSSVPMYRSQCNSPKKLLNVLDAMLMTCPVSKRRNSQHCSKFFNDVINSAPNQNVTKENMDRMLQHFNHVFLPSKLKTTSTRPVKTSSPKKVVITYTKTNPLLDFGVLNSSSIPPVETINLREKSTQIPIILPVYMRLRSTSNSLARSTSNSPNSLAMDTASLGRYKNGVFQSEPFLLHGKVPATQPINGPFYP